MKPDTKIKAKIKKGDTVVVVSGKDSGAAFGKGKTGEVLKVIDGRKVVVQGVNIVKKHQKPSMVAAGGIIEIEHAIDISNVALMDPKDKLPTRVGYKTLEDGRKVRYAKRSGELLD